MLVSYRGGRDKKLLADATQMLTDSKAKIDYLKMRINKARTSRATAASAESSSGQPNSSRKFSHFCSFFYGLSASTGSLSEDSLKGYANVFLHFTIPSNCFPV